jgi:hypothetical protein
VRSRHILGSRPERRRRTTSSVELALREQWTSSKRVAFAIAAEPDTRVNDYRAALCRLRKPPAASEGRPVRASPATIVASACGPADFHVRHRRALGFRGAPRIATSPRRELEGLSTDDVHRIGSTWLRFRRRRLLRDQRSRVSGQDGRAAYRSRERPARDTAFSLRGERRYETEAQLLQRVAATARTNPGVVLRLLRRRPSGALMLRNSWTTLATYALVPRRVSGTKLVFCREASRAIWCG